MAKRVNISKRFFHLSWCSDVRRMDLSDPRQMREWVQMVLERGRARDIRKLDLNQVRALLPSLRLSPETRSLWQNYFAHSR